MIMTRITYFIPFFFLLTLCPAIANAALAPRASGVSSCFVCPSTDEGGFSSGDNSDTNDVLFCSYPAFPGEDPNDFFCTYNDATGALIEDQDAGFCPGTAVGTTCVTQQLKKRETIVQALKRRAEARAAQPQTTRPEYMGARSALGKKKRGN